MDNPRIVVIGGGPTGLGAAYRLHELQHRKVQSILEIQPSDLIAPAPPEIRDTELHVWQFPLNQSASFLATCASLLSSDERTRASRFHFQHDQQRFTIARGIVRAVLGAYTHLPAQDLSFVYAPNGKPKLKDSISDFRFNVSHSGEMGLLGIALGREIGVDIETIRPEVETDKLAQRFFSAREREAIQSLPRERRVSAFFRCWSSKEAFLKAQGVGLSRSLDSFDVEVDPEKPACLLATRPHAHEAVEWRLNEIPCDAGYAAAAAAEGTVNRINILRCKKT